MKVLYTSDLHGDPLLYDKCLELAVAHGVEIFVFGGDLLPSLRKSGGYEAMAREQKSFAAYLHAYFTKCLRENVRHILTIPGNWDLMYPEITPGFVDGVVNLDRAKFILGGCEWLGYPFVPPTPFRPKDYEKMDDLESPWPPQKNPSYIYSSDPMHPLTAVDPHVYLKGQGTIRGDLPALQIPENHRRAIYVMHSPPYGTKLDRIQGGRFVGSHAIRSFIEGRQPLLTLHGHIHESPAVSGGYLERIGETLAVNPGQELGVEGGRIGLHAVLFETEDPEGTIRHTIFR